jgi:translocation and assembly module TamB
MRLRRYLLISLTGIGIILLLLLCLLAFLLYTPNGARWTLSLLQEATPLEIGADAVEGRLAGPLTIRQLRVKSGDLSLKVAEIGLDWRPSALLHGALHLIDFSLRGIDLTLPAGGQEPAGETQPFAGFVLPLDLSIDALSIDQVRIESPAMGQSQTLEHLALAAHGDGDRLQIDTLELAAFGAQLKVAGSLTLTPALPMALGVDWRYTLPDSGPTLSGRGRVEGDLERLQVRQQIDAPLAGTLQASLSQLQDQPRWDAVVKLKKGELATLLQGYPLDVKGELKSRGTPADIGLEADLQLDQPEYGKADLALQAGFAGGRLSARSLRLTTPAGTRIEGQGDYDTGVSPGRFSAELTWQGLRWPLRGKTVQFQSGQGSLGIDGTLEAYRYRLAMDAAVPGQPGGRLMSEGSGNRQGLKLQQLLATIGEGRLQGKGDLAWQPALGWQLSLDGSGIDPSLWLKDLPGRLDLALKSSGQTDATGLHARLDLDRLQGRLRDYPVSASGKAELQGERLTINSLQMRTGENRIELQGDVARQIALDWQLDAPALEAFWPGLEGALKGQGRLSGARDAPRIEASLKGDKLAFNESRIGKLNLQADLALSGEQAVSLDLQADNLLTGAGAWSGLDLSLKGRLPAHRLEVDLKGRDVPQTRFGIEAGWSDDSGWRGSLQRMTLNLPGEVEGQGAWQLTKPAQFVLSAGTQHLEPLCLASGKASLCGSFSADAGAGWQGQGQLRGFPLAALQPWMPSDLLIDGRVALDAEVNAQAGGQPVGKLKLELPEGRVGLDLSDQAQRVEFSGGELTASLDREGASARLHLPLSGHGDIEGNLALPGIDPLSPDMGQQTISGRLQAKLRDLSMISLVSPKLQNVHGRIESDLSLSGTLAQPKVEGGAELLEGAMDIPELGLGLREIGLQVKAPSLDELTLTGGLRSGKGHLQLEGSVRLDAAAGYPARLHMKGSNLTATDIPQAEVQISPDITFERGTPVSTLKGEIDIPYARIRPRKLPTSAVTNSPDLVVVGADESEQRKLDPKLSTELRVVFGKRVSFDGFGLRGNLTGSLLVIDEPGRPVIGRGRVGISDGTYRAYGQDLTIERGYALFADSPVDNPGLDVRAVREVEDVTAGIKVTGTLKSPKLDLFSTPAMSEGDALTYLVTGHAPGEGGSSVGLAAALKASGAGSVAEELGRQLGLEELRVETSGGLDQASVVAGKYLSPKLYLQYINELSSGETKLRMRYDINKRLQLEAETGNAQGGDLFYTFDR